MKNPQEIPTYYDIFSDEHIPVTQQKLDELCNIASAYGQLKEAFDKIHATLLGKIT